MFSQVQCWFWMVFTFSWMVVSVQRGDELFVAGRPWFVVELRIGARCYSRVIWPLMYGVFGLFCSMSPVGYSLLRSVFTGVWELCGSVFVVWFTFTTRIIVDVDRSFRHGAFPVFACFVSNSYHSFDIFTVWFVSWAGHVNFV